jgi:chemotaxis protein MotB
MRRKSKRPPENHERWLVSYADFVTLLFAFFVVMFATSQTDKGRAKQIQESVKHALEHDQVASAIAGILGGTIDDKGKGSAQMKGPGGQQPLNQPLQTEGQYAELRPAMEFLNKELQQEIAKGQMEVTMEARGLVVSFRQAAFFPSGTDEIPEQTFGTVAKVAEVIQKLPNPIRLEGHTDSVPIRGGMFRSNWELSAARSISMMELLVECCGVARERLSVAGYAENAPAGDNATEEGRMRNRRVDIVILNKTGVQAEPARATKQ